jgi:hypothetical protein
MIIMITLTLHACGDPLGNDCFSVDLLRSAHRGWEEQCSLEGSVPNSHGAIVIVVVGEHFGETQDLDVQFT